MILFHSSNYQTFCFFFLSRSNQYQTQLPGLEEAAKTTETNAIKPGQQQAENPEWKKAREALAKISPQNKNSVVKPGPNSHVQSSPLQQAGVPSYGYPYYQNYYMYGYPGPYNYPAYPIFQQDQQINQPQVVCKIL